MPNILFLPSWYPNKIYPQNGDFIQRHAEAVSAYCKVAVLYVLSDPEAKTFKIETSWHKTLFEVRVYYPKTSRFFPLGKFQKYFKANRLGYEAILKEMKQIDLVHLNVIYKAGLFALELKKRYKIPYIVTEHWTVFLPINPIRFSFFERYVIKKIGREASLLCPVSHDLKKALQQFGLPGPYEVVPNVVDTNVFSSQPLQQSSIKKILHISTLYDPHKNVTGLLNVIKKLSSTRQDFSLTIVGNHHVAKHQQSIKDLGLEDRVSIQGEIPHAQVARVMQAHDLFVLFSNYENLPCVIIEAQASGLPVLATDVGGIAEMVDQQSGQLVAAKDEVMLLEKMKEMLDQLENYDRELIRANAVQRFSYERVGERFKEIYEKVLSGAIKNTN